MNGFKMAIVTFMSTIADRAQIIMQDRCRGSFTFKISYYLNGSNLLHAKGSLLQVHAPSVSVLFIFKISYYLNGLNLLHANRPRACCLEALLAASAPLSQLHRDVRDYIEIAPIQ